jgi:hypothetical protein
VVLKYIHSLNLDYYLKGLNLATYNKMHGVVWLKQEEELQKMSQRLRDTFNKFQKSYIKDGKYQLILSNNSNDNVIYDE